MKAVTFGEIMMRLNPEGYLRFVQANSFEVSYAGGEANVAVSLANYGVDAAFSGLTGRFDLSTASAKYPFFETDLIYPSAIS